MDLNVHDMPRGPSDLVKVVCQFLPTTEISSLGDQLPRRIDLISHDATAGSF